MCEYTHRAETLVPCQETGPWQARHFTAAALCPEHAADVGLEAALVASELAKDLVYHGRSPATLSVDCWGSMVVISLHDTAPPDVQADPQRRQLLALMLERLTEGWGVDVDASGRRTFWCLLPASAMTPGALAGVARLEQSA